MEENIYKWYNWNLIINDKWILIKRGIKWFLFWWWLLWEKTIPFSSITAIQLKKWWLTAWFIQFTVKWSTEVKWWPLKTATDENSINFYSSQNKAFEEAKNIIEWHINWWEKNNYNNSNALNDLEKLADLKEKWIITQEEFDIKKKSLLNI